MAAKSSVFRFADVEVREREFSILRGGETLAVEPKAFRVLLILLRNPGQLISKQELLNGVWGDAAVTENSLARAVALLRKLLGDEARTPRFIETVATVGYRFLAPVEIVEHDGPIPDRSEPTVLQTDAEGAVPAPSMRLGANRAKRTLWLAIAAVATLTLVVAVRQWFLSRAQPRVLTIRQITNDGISKYFFVTDGTRIFYCARVGNESRVFQISSEGGEPVEMKELHGMCSIDISADHSKLLLEREADDTLWMASVVGGPARLVMKALGIGSLSPSGTEIAYGQDQELRIAQIDGSNSRTVARFDGAVFNMSWRPDGRKLMVTVGKGFTGSLWEVSPDGSGLKRLLPEGTRGSLWRGTWTPDGRYIVFSDGNLWAQREEKRPFELSHRGPFRLTTGPLRADGATVSPDGKRIFFSGLLSRVELIRYDPRTQQWVTFLPGLSATQLDYSPDGKSIAYVSYPEGAVFRSNRDGSGKLQLMPPPFTGMSPRWSPDGRQIAVAASRPGEPYRAYVISADGSETRRITNGECGHEGESDPVWSPDGSSIAFGCYQLLSGMDRELAVLRIVDLKTGQVSVLPNSQGLWSPRWAPQGRFFVALTSRFPRKLVLYDLQTHGQRELFAPKDGGRWPAVSRDGKFAFVWTPYGPLVTMDRVRISDGATEHAAGLTELQFDAWAGIAPDGSIIASRNTGSSEIYALDWDAP